jgi:hypothetical protein
MEYKSRKMIHFGRPLTRWLVIATGNMTILQVYADSGFWFTECKDFSSALSECPALLLENKHSKSNFRTFIQINN